MIAAGTAFSNTAFGTPSVTLATSLATPQPLGTPVTLTATGSDTDPGVISYKFEIGRGNSATFSMARDFSVDNTFVFTPVAHEGTYEFMVIARNNSTLNTATYIYSGFRFTSLVIGGAPTITPTANPLVALLSSPGCAAGGLYMRVRVLRSAAGANPSFTPWSPCKAGQNLNFTLAG